MQNTLNNNGDIVSGSKVIYHGHLYDVGEVYHDYIVLYLNGKKVACAKKYEVTVQ